MVAAPGNNYAVKLKDSPSRQRAYDSYCTWLAKGKTKKSFSFVEVQEDGSVLRCIWATMEAYLKENPQDFDPLKKEVAYSQGCAFWEDAVDETALGIRKDTSVPTLNMIMRNKYKWDTPENNEEAQESRADLDRYAKNVAQGRFERVEAPPANHNAKPADSDVNLPSARRFE